MSANLRQRAGTLWWHLGFLGSYPGGYAAPPERSIQATSLKYENEFGLTCLYLALAVIKLHHCETARNWKKPIMFWEHRNTDLLQSKVRVSFAESGYPYHCERG